MGDDTQDFILRLYDAATDNSIWPVVLQDFADRINAVGCIVFEWDNSAGQPTLTAPICSAHYDPEAVSTYIERCFTHEARDQDIFEAHSLVSDRIDLIEDDVLAENDTALDLLPNVQVLQKLGIRHRAAGLLNKDNRATARFSIQLGADRGRFITDERLQIATILPHIAKALDLGRPAQQLAATQRSMLSAMDLLTIGVCILDPQGRIVYENEEFARQRDAYPVFSTDRNGALELNKSADQKRF
ncbi:MAG: hypothetical protein AAF826_03795, partial [Pseudomonadota bacterium]